VARPLRLEYPGAIYHLIARGHERSNIYRDADDRKKFLALLGSIGRDEQWLVHAYCLMTNHYHLLVETPKGVLSRGMRSLNGRYTQWFNRRHKRNGHLFEGRFKSVLVQKESHLLELVRYVVLNPVRARLVERPGDWRWSSYRATSGRGPAPEWLERDWTLGQFARNRSAAGEAFRRFVAEGRNDGKAIEDLERRPYVGDQAFLEKIQVMVAERHSEEIPLRFRKLVETDLEAIRTAVAKEWHVAPESLSRRRGGAQKKAAIYLARKLTHLAGRQIGQAFGVKSARVSNIVTEIEQGRDPALTARAERLRVRLSDV
jgi:REP-associated tyrosine transposase